MQLLLKRSKIFMAQLPGEGEQRATYPPGHHVAPSWIRTTGTYKNGVKDGSIVDLSEQARLQELALAAQEDREPEVIKEEDPPAQELPAAMQTGVPAGLVNGQNKVKKVK